MRIIIDLQGAQTESRFRGIGRYSLSLAQAIVRNRGEHEVILVLNGLFPDTIEPIRAAFDGLLSQENIRVWYAPGPVRECDPSNKWRREVAECIREAFLASLEPDVVHVMSLFEGYVDDAVTSIGQFTSQLSTLVTLYDLIPLLQPDAYLNGNTGYAQFYQRKIASLKRSDRWLAISKSAAEEGQNALAFRSNAVINISAACDAIFQQMDITASEKQQLLTRFGITQPFILYSGGDDARKNLPRLVGAYARLNKSLCDKYQLVLVGKMFENTVLILEQIVKSASIDENKLIFTGYVTDKELAQFYNLCTVFVFPSYHEGFGLPVLEAMSCGAAVIASNTSSVPEVIERRDALFDPYDEAAISQKLADVLGDEAFRTDLAAYGLKQALNFSWDDSALKTIEAFESLHAERKCPVYLAQTSGCRPKLAYVSPLPPERTGIADYSAELLPVLAKYYDIEVVVAQEQVSDTWVQTKCPIRDSQWLRSNAHKMDRVLYHVGNSPFHQHMFSLIEEIPGTVVLHDFFLSGLLSYLENFDIIKYAWVHALYQSHGYLAVQERYHESESGDVQTKYPVNLPILQNAQGVIVHSDYSRNLANEWYGNNFSEHWKVIPLLRKPCKKIGRAQSRKILGLKVDEYVICSFGFLDSTKLNHCLLEAWLESGLSKDLNCVLIFVGENHGGEYGVRLLENIRASGLVKRIFISGWVDSVTYSHYLAAADLAVQLRTLSRGETSAAVLDCMNHALPTIVNANGSMANLPSDAVWRIPDNFAQSQLVEALEILWKNAEKRITLGKRAQKNIHTQHAPDQCAKQYVEAIEQFHAQSQCDTPILIKAIRDLDSHSATDTEYRQLAQTIAQSFPARQPVRQFMLDITTICHTDLKTGIERVVKSLLINMLNIPPAGYRVEPVYLSNVGGFWHYRYASKFTLGLLDCPSQALDDEVVEPRSGDILLGLDLSGQRLIEAEAAGLFANYRNIGVAVYFTVYDLLPVQLPQFFPPGTDASHFKWLQTIGKFDGAVCISATVANELSAWLKINSVEQHRPFRISWFHLGADLENSNPTSGLPKKAPETLAQLGNRPSFLMVGTIEPRKGYLQTLDAFTKLWAQGVDINLVIVGNEGWKSLPDDRRRTIPEIIKRLRNHPECNKRLFWLEGISDEYLEKVYATSACLIAASEGEGFGLPIIEAAAHHMPIIARDIPVFREVANENAHYFSGDSASNLADVIKEWLMLFEKNEISSKLGTQWRTWKQSAAMLLASVIGGKWPHCIVPPSVRSRAIDQHLNLIHQARVLMVSTMLPPGDIILDLGGANCPLYKMGYPYPFKKLVLIDLPPEERHEYYKEIVVDTHCEGGEVVIKYSDMTELDDFADGSIDFVWSGQSIEHVSEEAGKRMCLAAFRVLKRGGAFCLDTPNRRLTEIHTRDIGGGYIHPEHCIEYFPHHLKKVLEEAGFEIQIAKGICEMPTTLATDEFHYEDFIYGNQITDDITSGYIQFFHCLKP